MKSITALKNLNLICWPTLFIGFQKGWASKSDIADYAERLLSEDLDHGDENIAVLASANSLDDSEISRILLQVVHELNLETEVEKWKLAKLSVLNESALSEQDKLDKLQELYAEFCYPEDMASCSIYSQDTADPLLAIKDVIAGLKNKFR